MSFRKCNMWIFLLIFATCSGDTSRELDPIKETRDLKIDTEIGSLFTSLSRKSSPLYICDAELGGIEYQPPSTIDCQSDPKDTDITKIINITLFWTDVSKHIVKGYECSGLKETIKAYYVLFGLHDTFRLKEKIKVTADECWKMFEDRKAPNGDALSRTSDELFETKKFMDINVPRYYFGVSRDFEVVNYRIQEVQIGVRESDGMIRTTSMIENECHYNVSQCPTSHGILVWKGRDVKTCRLLEGEKSSCLLRNGTDNVTITCPDLTLSLHGFKVIKMCGVYFGHSQGIYFLQNNSSHVDERMAVPSMIRHKISGKRQKRETNHNKVHPFEAEMKANLNYLYETLSRGTSTATWKLEKRICELNKQHLELLSALAQSGHPSLTTRFMYRNPALRAVYEGDLLSIYQCIEINEYMFLERKSCTYQWPVKYVYRHSVYVGYVEPMNHTIVHVPTNQTASSSMHCKRFFFKTEDYTVLLGQHHAVKINADALPQPISRDHKNSFPEITFLPTGNLKATSEDDMESLFKLVRESQLRNSPNTARKGEGHIHETHIESSFGWMLALVSFIGNGIYTIYSCVEFIFRLFGFGSFFTIIVFIVVGGLCISFLPQLSMVGKIACIPVKVISYGCSLLTYPLRNGQFWKKARKSLFGKNRKSKYDHRSLHY